MPQVRMRRQMSGTRNGTHWPAPGEVVELDDDEAATLVRHGNAAYVDDEDDETDEDLAAVPEGESTEQPAESEAEPPARSENKPAWVDYAITRGLTRAEAEAMTKDELVARFAAEE